MVDAACESRRVHVVIHVCLCVFNLCVCVCACVCLTCLFAGAQGHCGVQRRVGAYVTLFLHCIFVTLCLGTSLAQTPGYEVHLIEELDSVCTPNVIAVSLC